MVFTCRVLCPLVITKASVRPSNSPMARMVVLSPDLLSAALAATRHSAGTSPPSWSTSGRALVDVKDGLLLALWRRRPRRPGGEGGRGGGGGGTRRRAPMRTPAPAGPRHGRGPAPRSG